MGSDPDRGGISKLATVREEDLEAIARREHNEWLEFMEVRGYHPPSYCPKVGRGCVKCNPDMLPYDRLPEDVRKRQSIRIQNMGRIMEDLGYTVLPMSPLDVERMEIIPEIRERLELLAPKPMAIRPNIRPSP
jgi:hypothetical protein